MPTIAIFYGIIVQMYYNDHNPAHFHARYGNAKAVVRIPDGQTLAEALPPTAARLVGEWAVARRLELEANWQRGRTEAPFQKVASPDGQG